MCKTIILFISYVLVFCACQNEPRKIHLLNTNGLVETQLGNSGCQVKHPSTMQLVVDEWRQARDDSDFVFSKPDSLAPFCNAFAIGLNVSDSIKLLGYDLPIIEQSQSEVLGFDVHWNIRKSDTGYFVADAKLREMKFIATSKTQIGIDSMIAMVSTLSSQ